ncbi:MULTISPECIES: hypothetical protein [Alistipes]|jgi:hypothetical protein|uniref:hypothetical protein n=1 Tax=Alistipes TaxID=239759 RepID=UPI0023F20A8A|nr:hypothetical protein [Alistipes sp.]
MTHSLQRQTPTADIKLPGNGSVETPEVEDIERAVEQIRRVSMNGGRDSVFLAEVERDSIGEVTMKGGTVPTVYVVAKSKTVAERNGEIALDFIIGIPATLQNNTWGLSLTPVVENNGTEEALQPLSIRGELFSEVQKRQYWQMNKYLNRILGDTTGLSSTVSLAAKYYEAYNRYLGNNKKRLAEKLETTYKETISFPYLSDPRLDSVLLRKGELRYYYTQRYRPTKNTHRLHLYFRGYIDAIDRSQYALANSDTLTYTVTSMLSLLDNEPRYMLKVIDKYVEVRDRNYITFPVGRANVIDTMGQNLVQLAKIERLMDTLINQYEFFVDSITIIASSSPDGSMATNNRIAGERARSIKERLVRKFGHEVDTLIRTRSIGEDWALLKRLIRHNSDMPNWEQITAMIDQSRNLDVTEPQIRQQFPKDYAYMKEVLYPQLRAVDFRYNLRRVDMVKDTVVLTVLDTTYMRGVQQLRDRDYVGALRTLNDYKSQNLAIVLLSLGYDEAALEILKQLPAKEKNAKTDYLSAIALSRINRPQEGLECYLKAIQTDPVLKFRGNLDPEIQILYKQNNVTSTAYNN